MQLYTEIHITSDGQESNEMIAFAGGSDGKQSTCNMGHLGSIPGSGRSTGEWSDNSVPLLCTVLVSPEPEKKKRKEIS